MEQLDFNPYQPIYLQLMNRISSEIVRGDRKAGEKLTSVRDYALEVGVNVNTIQRVYRELENLDIVETRRGQGTFVTNDEQKLWKLRENMKIEYIQSFIQNMEEMGYSMDEIITSLNDVGGAKNDSGE